MFHGRQDTNTCLAGQVAIFDPAAARDIPACGPGRVEVTSADTGPWNGMIRLDVDPLTVPPSETLDPEPGRIYWDRAELRVMLDLNDAPPTIEVRRPDGVVDVAGTAYLDGGCAGRTPVAQTPGAFHNARENADIEMLEIDLGDLLDCLELNSAVIGGKLLSDTTEGGLVFYLGVDGPDSTTVNDYGVRIKNGARLAPTVGATSISGLTIVTNQALYIEGDYNSDADWKPAAFLADSINLLSNAWNDADATHVGSDTSVYAGFLAGTDTTGSGNYNGGMENYPRFHEDWSGATLVYRGSFVSLDEPRHVDGPWSAQVYSPPDRDWGYELRFNDAANLPPLTPRFVSLRQDQFLRRYDL
jgi:hypothetical protein